MRFYQIPVVLLLCGSISGQAIVDSISLPEVSITATRSEQLLSRIPLPTMNISAQEIQHSGAQQLQNILSEQVGLEIIPQVNGLGSGIQMQGLNPDYTLILVDGEPLIGRYTGSLELSRITLSNIKKIEIVKGPSSSLYGSEAMAGVIHIITDQAYVTKLEGGVRYGTFNNQDVHVLGNWVQNHWKFQGFIQRMHSEGYDLSPHTFGQTVSPYSNGTAQLRCIYQPNPQTIWTQSFRGFLENQENQYQVIQGADSIRVGGTGEVKDWQWQSGFQKKWGGDKWTLNIKNYWTRYTTQTHLDQVESGADYYNDHFTQSFVRPEVNASSKISNIGIVQSGMGWIYEKVSSSRYGSDLESHIQSTFYAFAQQSWDMHPRWNAVIGLRYDQNSTYASVWSPKLAVQYLLHPKHRLKVSFGTGFKAPDFRQLYLNFRNEAAGYSVFGTDVVMTELRSLQSKGQLNATYVDLNKEIVLQPESSRAWNLGSSHQLSNKWSIECNVFRNDLKGLIETQIVATTKNNQPIYSYTNINRVITQGGELVCKMQYGKGHWIQLGYQYLEAKDKDVMDAIQAGTMYGRDPVTLESYRIKGGDYFGLPNRSRHQIQGKWQTLLPLGIGIQSRVTYHSPFGLAATTGNVSGIQVPASDMNQNGILDRYDRFVDGYVQVHLTLERELSKFWTVQVGGENLLNYQDPVHIPTLTGRKLFVHLKYQLIKS